MIAVVIGSSCSDDITTSPRDEGVRGVRVSPDTLRIVVGQVAPLAAVVDASPGVDRALTWSTGNPSVARVDVSGNVTGVSVGATVATATSNADPSRFDSSVIEVAARPAFDVLATDPDAGDTGVAWDAVVRATFSAAVDPTSVTGASFTLTGPAGAVSGGTGAGGDVATFTPSVPLAGESTYTARLTTSVRSLTGFALAQPVVWSFTTAPIVDVDPPVVVDTSPEDGAVDVSPGAVFVATFSEDVDPLSVTPSTFTLTGPGGAVAGTIDAAGAAATFTPGALLDGETAYTARVTTGITDLAGNPLGADVTWSVTTALSDVDPPTVTRTTPADGATDVPPDIAIGVAFSEVIDPGTVDATTFTLQGPAGSVTGMVGAGGSSASFAPTATLASSTTYTARLTTGIADLAGNPLASDVEWSFTTADVVPPSVTATQPLDGAIDVPLDVVVGAAFSEDVDPASVTTSTFTLIGPGGAVAGSVDASGSAVTFQAFGPLASDATYTARLTTGITDLAGNPLAADVTWSFTTVDVEGPAVVTTLPASGATGVPLDVIVSAELSEDIDPATATESTFRVTGPGGAVTGGVNAAGRAIAFDPTDDLASATTYTARLTTGITDLAGNPLAAEFTWSFTTSDVEPPRVTATSPADEAVDVSPGVVVSASFSEPIDPASATAETFTLSGPGGDVAGVVEASGSSAQLTPSAPLTGSTAYTARITTGIRDLAGNPLEAGVEWSFTTAFVDTEPPVVTSTEPADEAVDVAPDVVVRASFSEEIDASTVTPASFTLTGPGGAVGGAAAAAGNTATFTPSADLAGETAYTARITRAVTDVVGNPLAEEVVWSFTIADVTPPSVTGISPADGAVDQAPGVSITATFSEDVDPASVTPSTFSLEGPTGTVAGSVSASGNMATFDPTAALASATTYTVRLETGIEDLAGNPLAAVFTSTFTVADVEAPGVLERFPVDGAVDVPLDVVVSATFSEEIDPATVDGRSVMLTGPRGSVAGDVAVSTFGDAVTFTPLAPLDGDIPYTATLTTAITDLAGNPLQTDVIWSFTTVPVDTESPTVLTIDPADGAVDVPLDAVITVTYSEDVGSVTAGTFRVRATGGPPPVDGTRSTVGSTTTFTPTGDLDGFTAYTVELTTGIQDLAGNPLVAFDAGFTTLDPDPPRVIETSPADGATDVDESASVVATFSEDVNPGSVTPTSFRVRRDGVDVDGSLNVSGPTATFVPSAPLESASVHEASLTTDITDLDGSPIAAGAVWTFETNRGPLAIDFDPPNGAVDVPVSATVSVTFDEPIDPATVTSSSFFVTGPDGAVAGTVDAVGASATFTPAAPLGGGRSYTAMVTGSVTDLAGNPLIAGVNWTFTTEVLFGNVVLNGANGHYYELVEQLDITWPAARADAAARTHLGLRGYLACIADADENAFVDALVPFATKPVWIGGYQVDGDVDSAEPDGGWRWVTGEPFAFTAWAFGRPNDVVGDSDFLELRTSGWNDTQLDTDDMNGYVIEYGPREDLDAGDVYRITNATLVSGERLTVSAIEPPLLFMGTDDSDASRWRLGPVGTTGFLRLSPVVLGVDRVIDGGDGGAPATIVDVADDADQYWTLTAVELGGDYLYRLRTSGGGVGRSLDYVDDGDRYPPILAVTGAVPRQLWRLVALP